MTERLPILWHYLQARWRFQRWHDRAALEAWQEKQVVHHLDRITERSAYFRDITSKHGIKHWRTWPTAGKAEMMKHFDQWNTVRVRLDDAWKLAVESERTRDFTRTLNGVTVGLSSGTSGSRGVFLASVSERPMWVGTLLSRVLQGTLMHHHRAALFLRANSPLYQTIGSNRFRFEFFDLLHPIEDHWSRLRDLRPTILAAPPNVLTRLAAQEGAANLLAPPAILLSVADVLDDADRACIERGFGRPIGQIYQATEGFLAATCPQGRLHWNEDVVVVQKDWLDEARTRYAPIITDFRRFTQPIVRHRLDDVIVEDDGPPCPCGSVFGTLKAIEGRCDDVLRLPSLKGDAEITVFPDFVRRAVVFAIPTGIEYAVTQTSLTRWELSFSEACDMEPVRRELMELCQRLGAVMPELVTVAWSPPPQDAKRRRVRRIM